MSEAFYIRDGEQWLSQAHTRGPWHPDFQHAGPPCGLLARALEQRAEDMQIVRLGVDLLRPVPISALRIRVSELTGGRRRRILQAELLDTSDTLVARAQALLLRRDTLDLGVLPNHDPQAPVPPEQAEPYAFNFFSTDVGYHTAMELRRAAGEQLSGAARMWMRQRIPLIAGETGSPLQRLMVVADSGNGVSMVLDTRRFAFMNPDLTVNIRRDAVGDWLCLDARTHCQPTGIGMAESRIWDRHGVVANGNQNLLVEPLSQ